MRIYKQIPFAGTEAEDPEERTHQAVDPYEPRELIAIKAFGVSYVCRVGGTPPGVPYSRHLVESLSC